ncbi:hypothetical protein D9615_003240 [Tricholomella constricta]|uniref:Uncharacterized protein n=1 Tax=Tricholomella constricta TaxID=117010 RepID=A0A8H5M7J9_9AGAR|nr:hypothetical protein D9615_003240 [Tricholomella constricta]
MPVLSSFISYRPKRRTKAPIKVSPPFPVQNYNPASSPHPYASPRIIDIHDGRVPAPSPIPKPKPLYDVTSTQRVKLDVEINPEPLTDWFPTQFLDSDPFTLSLEGETPGASGSGMHYGAEHDASDAERSNGIFSAQKDKEERTHVEDGGDDEEGIRVLSRLEAMDASSFIGQSGMVRYLEPQPTWKKPAPRPIKIPNAALHGPQVQVVRTPEFSRPTSQLSSPESSAVSGTTLARALLANPYVLSAESRASRYRSGGSELTRTDSATLPRGEFSFIHSPNRRDGASLDLALSPGAVLIGPVPPVPENAEKVYVPPRTTRQSTDARERLKTPPSSGREGEGVPSKQKRAEEGSFASRQTPRIIEATSSLPPTPQLAYTLPDTVEGRPSKHKRDPSPPPPPPASEPETSRRDSKRPDSGAESDGISEAIVSPSLSDAPSSAKDLDILSYYSFAETPPPNVGIFRLPFSPIPEEQSSSLSPPIPYVPDNRDSKSSLPPGRFFLGTTPSASINGARLDWDVRISGRRDTNSKQLLPIGDHPGNQTQTSSSASANHRSSFSPSSTSSSNNLPDIDVNTLSPPSVFNNLRSGITPSPIKVVRDPRDLTAYNITVTPRSSGENDSPPITGNSDIIQQTFPETPNAFSPGFTPNGIALSPGMHGSGVMSDYMSMVPQTPMSAFLPAAGSIQPSLAQQVLLTRAATSVHVSRHSRQMSRERLVRQQVHPHPRPSSVVTHGTTAAEQPVLADQVAPPSDSDAPESALNASKASVEDEIRQGSKPPVVNESWSQVVEKPLPMEPAPTPSPQSASPSPPEPLAPALGTVSLPQVTPTSSMQTTLPNTPTTLAELTTTPCSSSHEAQEAILAYDEVAPGQISGERSRAPSRAASNRSNAPIDSPTSTTNLSLESPASRIPSPAALNPPPASTLEHSLGRSNDGPSTSSTSSLGTLNTPASSHRSDASPMQRHEPIQTPTPVITPVANTSTTLRVPPSPSARRPDMITPPPPHAQVPSAQLSASSLYSTSYDVGMSPPPYYAVINFDRSAGDSFTPSTGGSSDPNYRFGTPNQPHSPAPNAGEFVVGSSNGVLPKGQGQPTGNLRRPRTRPPLPAGPRRPSQQHGPLSFSNIIGMRERGGSVSSVNSQNHVPSNRRGPAAPLPSPRFHTPPPRWRGYTMDAAKWTFTSTQLQAIVSRAIRQSSEASSIRLLRLETLDNEIPEEIERLKTARTDTKMRYKILARRRANMLEALANSVDGLDQDGPALAIRLVEELKELSGAMDKLTEELHSVDGQLAQLAQLCQAHSTSALAMALRKLNASFLKQFAEAQALRQQVETLEAERDEAWKQAEDVAHDYEDLRSGKIESPEAEKRFIRVASVRKSSVRASKAGLRTTSIRSNQRSSTSSSNRGFGANAPLSSRNTYADDLPPVPPVPRRRPVDIKTNLPFRSSTITGLSTEGPTPTSETRAMVRAQEELYEMLGIQPNDRSRRPRSVIGLPGESELSQQAASPSYSHYDVPPNTGRRASLPGSAAPPSDPYNTFTADVSIILTSDRAGWI